MSVYEKVNCPHCGCDDVRKFGKLGNKQRYQCNKGCGKTFRTEYSYKAYNPGVKDKIVDMAVNGSGIRDTARVLKVSATTVMSTIKKACNLVKVNYRYLENQTNLSVSLFKLEVEADEQWSFVGKKANQRWLWFAIEHISREVLAFTFGSREDKAFARLKKLLKPFGIEKYFTDDCGAYERQLPKDQHEIGKRNTQRIERKNLNFRTRIKRLARKTICFSKSEIMHDTVIGLFINRYEFGRNA